MCTTLDILEMSAVKRFFVYRQSLIFIKVLNTTLDLD